ncbi:MAG: chemotaxis protein CheA [Bacillota bacterium]
MAEGYTLGPEDIKLFLSETIDQLGLLEEEIVRLEGEGPDPRLLQDMFRIAHTVKGSSAAVGHTTMSTLAHAMEDVFAALRDGRLAPDHELTDVLLDAVDALKGLVAEFEADSSASGDAEVIERLLVRLLQVVSQDAGTYKVLVTFANDTAMPSVRALQVVQALGEVGTVSRSCPSIEDIRAERAGLTLEAVVVVPLGVGEAEIEQRLREISDVESMEVCRQAIAGTGLNPANIGPDETVVPDKSGIDASATAWGAVQAKGSHGGPGLGSGDSAGAGSPGHNAPRMLGRSADQTIRVDVASFDRLVRITSELAIEETRLAEIERRLAAAHEHSEHIQDLEQVIARIGRLTTELQEEVMKARMTPLASLFRRFPRMVRDIAVSSGKQVEFVVEGEDTELDRALIDEVADPIIHLLRNAVGHGIELPEERTRLGKPEAGRVRLAARHVEDRVVISVEDDGTGIDPVRLRESAVRKGIMSAERAAALGDEDAIELIFQPGFSTASQISDVSGRGVGLDIVRTNVEKLGGTVRVKTSPGKGTTFVMSVPLTLAVFRALLVVSGGQEFAIPLSSVVEVTRVPLSEVKSAGKGSAIVLRGKVLPVFDLADFAGQEGGGAGAGSRRTRAFVVVARYEDMRVGIIVDSLLGEQEIVIKNLGKLARCVKGLLGGAILGDGRVALILDVARVLEKAMGRTRVAGPGHQGGTNDEPELQLHC